MEELWKEIAGFDGYEVSNYGRVRHTYYVKTKNTTKVRYLNGYNNWIKYRLVSLRNNSQTTTYRIHRLVAESFIPNPYNKLEINHIDGNKANNHVSNLEWVTHLENMQHALKTGLWKPAEGMLGKRGILYKRSKKVYQFSLGGELIAEYANATEAATALGLHQSVISNCVAKKEGAFTCGGFKWSFTKEFDTRREIKYNAYKVYKFDLNGNLLNEYDSSTKAAQANEISRDKIVRVIKSDTKIYKGAIWSFTPILG